MSSNLEMMMKSIILALFPEIVQKTKHTRTVGFVEKADRLYRCAPPLRHYRFMPIYIATIRIAPIEGFKKFK